MTATRYQTRTYKEAANRLADQGYVKVRTDNHDGLRAEMWEQDCFLNASKAMVLVHTWTTGGHRCRITIRPR